MSDQHLIGTEGDDFLQAAEGNDWLEGLGGNDVLLGGAGDDLYMPGAGADFISDFSGFDELRFDAGISPDQVERIRQSGSNDLILRVLGTGTQVTLGGWFSDPSNQIERVVFDDGTVWDPATTASLRILGTGGNDILFGTEYDERIEGRGGSDTIYAGAGNDVLDGGDSSSDSLNGGAGADTYLFGRGSGSDSVWASGSILSEDRVQLGAGITLADISVQWAPSSFYLTIAGTHDSLAVIGDYPEDARLAEVAFADGASLSAAAIDRKIFVSDDLLTGGASADTLDGGLGDDGLQGGDGDDFLYGDAGNDWMWGAAGADTYFFGRGDGTDTIMGGGLAEDRLVLGSGISMADVQATRAADDLWLDLHGSHDRVVVAGYFLPGGALSIEFADGASWDGAAIDRKIVRDQ